MAQITLSCTSDAFNNNVSGFYDSENFITVGATSSSNAIENDGLWRFPAAGLAVGDTITAISLYFYCIADNDGNMVASYDWYTDVNDVWGTLDASDPPNVNMASGTQFSASNPSGYAVNAWNEVPFIYLTLSTFPKNAAFNIGCTASLGDVGPANLDMDSIENTNARSPYPAGSGQTDGRVFLLITYTPASASKSPGGGVAYSGGASMSF